MYLPGRAMHTDLGKQSSFVEHGSELVLRRPVSSQVSLNLPGNLAAAYQAVAANTSRTLHVVGMISKLTGLFVPHVIGKNQDHVVLTGAYHRRVESERHVDILGSDLVDRDVTGSQQPTIEPDGACSVPSGRQRQVQSALSTGGVKVTTEEEIALMVPIVFRVEHRLALVILVRLVEVV